MNREPAIRQAGITEAKLVVKSVTKTFSGLTALNDVSLVVERGKILGLTGPNGSGKSTLVNVVTGILAPDSGSVVIDGVDFTGRPSFDIARAGIARSFQTVRLFGDLTVRENIAAVIRNPRHRMDVVVDELLDRVQIAHLGDTLAKTLAYGLQRRVEIARALATSPRYLLLDEPAAGLNDDEGHELEAVIRSVARSEDYACGVLIIDHEMRLLTSLCDRLHVLANGTTLAHGTPHEVRHDPAVIDAYIGGNG